VSVVVEVPTTSTLVGAATTPSVLGVGSGVCVGCGVWGVGCGVWDVGCGMCGGRMWGFGGEVGCVYACVCMYVNETAENLKTIGSPNISYLLTLIAFSSVLSRLVLQGTESQ